MTGMCDQNEWPSNAEWLSRFRMNAARARVPVSGMLELTRRCNLRCIHCYARGVAGDLAGTPEMSAAQVRHVIDEAVEAGCLYMTLTGGEPMLRSDFSELYRHAVSSGLVVNIFSNGTMITAGIVALLGEFSPRVVEITLYGDTPDVHDGITGVKGSHVQACEGIERLLEHGIRTAVKTVVMKGNVQEVFALEQRAAEWGIPFRLDPVLFSSLAGAGVVAEDLRVSPEVAVEVELREPRRRYQWLEYIEKRKDIPPTNDLYTCGGGLTGFFVDAFGNMSPCLLAVEYRYSILAKSFRVCWEEDIPEMRRQVAHNAYPCGACEYRMSCTGCPALNYLETGEENVVYDYVCEIAKRRHDVLELHEERELSAGAKL